MFSENKEMVLRKVLNRQNSFNISTKKVDIYWNRDQWLSAVV